MLRRVLFYQEQYFRAIAVLSEFYRRFNSAVCDDHYYDSDVRAFVSCRSKCDYSAFCCPVFQHVHNDSVSVVSRSVPCGRARVYAHHTIAIISILLRCLSYTSVIIFLYIYNRVSRTACTDISVSATARCMVRLNARNIWLEFLLINPLRELFVWYFVAERMMDHAVVCTGFTLDRSTPRT